MKTNRLKQVGVSLSITEFEAVREAAFIEKKSISQFMRDNILKKIKYKEVKNG